LSVGADTLKIMVGRQTAFALTNGCVPCPLT
jgi:hypothetical protein